LSIPEQIAWIKNCLIEAGCAPELVREHLGQSNLWGLTRDVCWRDARTARSVCFMRALFIQTPVNAMPRCTKFLDNNRLTHHFILCQYKWLCDALFPVSVARGWLGSTDMAAVVVALVYHFFLSSHLGSALIILLVMSWVRCISLKATVTLNTFLALHCHCVDLFLTGDMLYYRRSMDIRTRTMKMSVTSVSVSLVQQPSLLWSCTSLSSHFRSASSVCLCASTRTHTLSN